MTAAAHAGPVHVLVMAKAPVAGRVKTRLCPPCSPEEAARVARAALADTLEAVAGCAADHKIVALDGPGLDGPDTHRLPGRLEVIPQSGGGFDERLADAWAATRARTGGWGIQIGMDTPQLTAAELDNLLGLLTAAPARSTGRARALLGPAVDGGWWVIGLPGTEPDLVFRGVPMSSPATMVRQEERLRSLGLDVEVVATHRDIDTADDLRTVAAAIPDSRTAAAARRVFDRVAVSTGPLPW